MKKIKLNPKDKKPRPVSETGPSDMTGLPMDFREKPVQDADDL